MKYFCFQEKGSFSIFLPWMEAGRTNIELQSASRFSFPTIQIPRLKFWIKTLNSEYEQQAQQEKTTLASWPYRT